MLKIGNENGVSLCRRCKRMPGMIQQGYTAEWILLEILG